MQAANGFSTTELSSLLNLARRGHLRLDARSAGELVGKLPARDVLSSKELEYWRSGKSCADPVMTTQPLALRHGSFVFVLKVTRLCNLRCRYCRSWAEGPGQVMTFPVLVETIRQAVSLPNARIIDFVLHGGETTLLKPRLLKKILWVQQQLKRPDQVMRNSIQTNAVDLSDEWIDLLKALRMSVGLSLDGPPDLNADRVDKDGRPTSGRVAHSIKKLSESGLLFGGLVVITRRAAAYDIRAMFEYFLSIGLRNIDFLNVLPDNAQLSDVQADCSHDISFDEYVSFLCKSFLIWSTEFRGRIHISMFDDLLKGVAGLHRPKGCLWSGNCMTRIFTIEPSGDVGACDKFIGVPNFTYGNILKSSLDSLVSSSSLVNDVVSRQSEHRKNTAACEWTSVCQGGCPHDQFLDRQIRDIHVRTCCGLSPLLNAMRATIESDPGFHSDILGKTRSKSRGELDNRRPQEELNYERTKQSIA